MRSTLLRTALVALALPALALSLHAQENPFSIPIIVHNNGTGIDLGQDTVVIGLHPQATYGIDAALGEEELPPMPPSGVFDLRSVGLTGHTTTTPEGMGEGLALDLRTYTGPSQRDTFRIRFQAGDGGYPITVTWPDNLKQLAGTLTIKPQGGDVSDMLTTTSLVISDDAATLVTIIRENDAPSAVRDEVALGGKLFLAAAFNPVRRERGTTLTYRLPRAGNATLRLYTAAGELVETLLDEQKSATTYTQQLKTSSLPAGTYYCTLSLDGYSTSTVLTVVE